MVEEGAFAQKRAVYPLTLSCSVSSVAVMRSTTAKHCGAIPCPLARTRFAGWSSLTGPSPPCPDCPARKNVYACIQLLDNCVFWSIW